MLSQLHYFSLLCLVLVLIQFQLTRFNSIFSFTTLILVLVEFHFPKFNSGFDSVSGSFDLVSGSQV